MGQGWPDQRIERLAAGAAAIPGQAMGIAPATAQWLAAMGTGRMGTDNGADQLPRFLFLAQVINRLVALRGSQPIGL